ncbi:hypothetical protein F5Y09DRAFT_339304 [Xylaria sp. FL1042]|nr:hypothetical protein F5Y09DRAFT_339304 [Xylaria sp. FL1042]
MQEVACANRVLLIARDETLDWDNVAAFLRDDNRPYADAFHVTGGHSTLNGAVVSIFGVVQTIQQQRRIIKDVKSGKYESKLMDVLARFQYADAGDRRDIIYGLWVSCRRFFIDANANIDIICQNPWDVREPETKQAAEVLPSWVVDFANKRRFGLFEDGLESLLFAQRGIFSAGPSNCAVPCDVSQDGLLRARGVILGKVGIVLTGDFQGAFDLRQHPRKWMQLYFHEKLPDDSSAIYQPTNEPLFCAFWRTLIMDCKSYPVQRLSPEEIEDIYAHDADEDEILLLLEKQELLTDLALP